MVQQIEHRGIIQKIENNHIHVLIIQQSACGECLAKGTCLAADKVEKLIEVESSDSSFQIGEKVVLFGGQSFGIQAIFLVFVLPFILIFFALIISNLLLANEVISGVVAILILIPYYLILSFFNGKLKSKFSFEIKKSRTE